MIEGMWEFVLFNALGVGIILALAAIGLQMP
jgi:hypothetical protein